MKKIYTAALFLFFNIPLFSQSPLWTWAKKGTGTGDDRSKCIVTDASGNIYVAGYFTSTTLTFGTTTLSNAGGEDIFIVKYSPSGTVLWATAYGNNLNERANCMAIDVSGNIYVGGYFTSASLTLGTITLTNIDAVNVFFAKFNPSGNTVWANKAGSFGNGPSNVNCTGIAVDNFGGGHVYITGWYNGFLINLTGGAGGIGNANSATYDGFYAKYDTAGAPQVATHFGGMSDDFGYSIAADNLGNAFVSGTYNSSAFSFGATVLTYSGGYDAFVLKYDANTNESWIKSANGTGSEEAYSVTADVAGNVYITGYFSSATLYFGAAFINNSGVNNVFVAKYSNTGTNLWSEKFGGAGYEYADAISISPSGKLLLSGATSSASVTFGATTLTNATVGGGPYDVFVAQLETQAGSPQWAKNAGGSDYDEATGSVTDVNGNVYIAGIFASSPCSFGNNNLTWTGAAQTSDVFVAKLNSATGVNDLKNENSFSVYPNPASTELNVSVPTAIGIKLNVSDEIIITDVLGKIFYQAKIKQPTLYKKIQTTDFPDGIYFIQLFSENNTVIRKIIIQH